MPCSISDRDESSQLRKKTTHRFIWTGKTITPAELQCTCETKRGTHSSNSCKSGENSQHLRRWNVHMDFQLSLYKRDTQNLPIFTLTLFKTSGVDARNHSVSYGVTYANKIISSWSLEMGGSFNAGQKCTCIFTTPTFHCSVCCFVILATSVLQWNLRKITKTLHRSKHANPYFNARDDAPLTLAPLNPPSALCSLQ